MVQAQRHPFLDDLADNVVLVSSVLRQPLQGREQVTRAVKAGAGQYVSQTPRALGSIGERSYFEYDVTLAGGLEAAGLVSILRDGQGRVTHLNITFSPLGSVLALAAGLRDKLAPALGAEFFL